MVYTDQCVIDYCVWSCAGFQPKFMNLSGESLMCFVNVENFTLGNSQFINVNMTELQYIVSFVNTTNILVDQLESYGCSNWLALFFNNSADANSSTAFGNSIETASNSSVQIQSSNFHDTAAGAAWILFHDFTIRDSMFTNLNMSAGPVLWHDNDDSSHMDMSNCTFTNITVTPEEAPPEDIITLNRADMTMRDSTFSNCSASYAVIDITNDPTLNGSWLANETVTIDNCTFYNSYGFQGPVYMLGKDTIPTQTLNIYNSNFTFNAGYFGGAVTAFAVGTVEVCNCLFEGNEALTGVGAMYMYVLLPLQTAHV